MIPIGALKTFLKAWPECDVHDTTWNGIEDEKKLSNGIWVGRLPVKDKYYPMIIIGSMQLNPCNRRGMHILKRFLGTLRKKDAVYMLFLLAKVTMERAFINERRVRE